VVRTEPSVLLMAFSAGGGLDNVGIRSTINEGSTASGLDVGDDLTLAIDLGESGLEDIVNLFVTGSAEVDAAERVLAVSKGGSDFPELVGSQGAGGGLDVGKGLGDAELVARRGIGETNGLPESRINLLDEGGNGTRLCVAEIRLKVCGTTAGNVCDNKGEIVVGTRATSAKTLQPGIRGANDRAAAPLYEDLNKISGIETRGLRAGSDGKDGVLAFGRNVSLSKCAGDNRGNK